MKRVFRVIYALPVFRGGLSLSGGSEGNMYVLGFKSSWDVFCVSCDRTLQYLRKFILVYNFTVILAPFILYHFKVIEMLNLSKTEMIQSGGFLLWPHISPGSF